MFPLAAFAWQPWLLHLADPANSVCVAATSGGSKGQHQGGQWVARPTEVTEYRLPGFQQAALQFATQWAQPSLEKKNTSPACGFWTTLKNSG